MTAYLKINSNSQAIQPFLVDPRTAVPNIESYINRSNQLINNAIAVLKVNFGNVSKMGIDFVVPKGSVIIYGGTPHTVSTTWTSPATYEDRYVQLMPFFEYLHNYGRNNEVDITLIIPVEPQIGSEFCIKLNPDHQRYGAAQNIDLIKVFSFYEDTVCDDKEQSAFPHRLMLMPFKVEEPVAEEVVQAKSENMDFETWVNMIRSQRDAHQTEAEKKTEVYESLMTIREHVNFLKTMGYEVVVNVTRKNT
jgi:hypothetical protein